MSVRPGFVFGRGVAFVPGNAGARLAAGLVTPRVGLDAELTLPGRLTGTAVELVSPLVTLVLTSVSCVVLESAMLFDSGAVSVGRAGRLVCISGDGPGDGLGSAITAAA